MKKKVWLMAFLLVAASIGFGFFQGMNVFYHRNNDKGIGDRDFLVKTFDSSGAFVVETNINAYASNRDEFLDREEIMYTAAYLAKGMKLDLDSAQRIENFGDDYNQLSLIGKSIEGHRMAIIVHSMDFENIDEGPGGYETNIVIDISLNGSIEKISDMKDDIEALIGERIKGTRITSCIVGNFEKKYSSDDMENIIASILEYADAREIERAKGDNFLSVSAYTPHIDDYIDMRTDRINLNIALRYNSYEEKTYIWLGTPVIALEY